MSDSAAPFDESWQTLRTRINSNLNQYLDCRDPDIPARLSDAMAYSLTAGGKRLRPLLTLLACEACGGSVEAAIPAACAIEMVHTYSLIHDDLPAMDDDDLRRGRPTNHVKFGEAHAILAGDALLTLAFEVLATDLQPADVAVACSADLSRAAGAAGMVGGQIADLQAEDAGITHVTHLESIHRRKTGCLLCCALTMGGRIAGATAEQLQALGTFGNSVGLAFQIADDLLDVGGDRERMGKSVGKDEIQGKLTYPSLWGVERSREKARDLIRDACKAIAIFGERRHGLEKLAHFVFERDH